MFDPFTISDAFKRVLIFENKRNKEIKAHHGMLYQDEVMVRSDHQVGILYYSIVLLQVSHKHKQLRDNRLLKLVHLRLVGLPFNVFSVENRKIVTISVRKVDLMAKACTSITLSEKMLNSIRRVDLIRVFR